MTTLTIRRTSPGRYYGFGTSHTYLIARGDDGWNLTITRLLVIGGVRLTDPDARGETTGHDTLALCRAVAARFETLGDDYRPHEHGHRSRRTEAVTRAYDDDKAARA